MIEMDLRTYLLSKAAITSLIGQRVYPMRLPQGVTLPAVTYQVIAGDSEFSHDGDSAFGRRRVQFDCWGDTYAAVVSIAETIRDAVSGYLGAMGDTPSVAGRVVNQIDLSEPDVPLWRRLIEVQLWHQEAA